MANKPASVTVRSWLVSNYGRHFLAALTGQDSAALSAFATLLELYAFSDGEGRRCALRGMRAAAEAMQPKCRPIAKACIPHVLDWSDEASLWEMIRLEGPAWTEALPVLQPKHGPRYFNEAE